MRTNLLRSLISLGHIRYVRAAVTQRVLPCTSTLSTQSKFREVQSRCHNWPSHLSWPHNTGLVTSHNPVRGFSDHIKTPHQLPRLVTMKIDTPEFQALFTPELNALIALFAKYKFELRIAGGAVRDILLGRPCSDVDFATTATPSEMKDMFEKEEIRMINNKGEKHGTITCRMCDKENFEVTTLRIDVVTDGRHAEVEFTRDWQLDAMRRDLTINSMFLGFDGTIYDYFNGSEDLQDRKVRFVGSAEDRIREDYLRILRYFRFYGRTSEAANAHEQVTLDAIRHNADGLQGISGERIWSEVKKIVTGCHSAASTRVMHELGMFPYMGLPDSCNLDEYDKVWQRCQDLNPQPMTLITALLETEEQVYKFHERVKLSREELRTGVFILNHRGDDPTADVLRYCQDLVCDTTGKEPKVKDKICELLKYTGRGAVLEQFTAWDLPRFPVSGHRLLEAGVAKGPTLAKTLAALREKWKLSEYTYSEADLMCFVEELKQQLQ